MHRAAGWLYGQPEPTARPEAQDGADPRPTRGSLMLYIYDNKRVVGTRQTCHDEAIQTCRSLFPAIPSSHTISFHTRDLDICDGEMAEIPATSWPDAIPHLKSVIVISAAARETQMINIGHVDISLAGFPKTTLRFEAPTGKSLVVAMGIHNNLNSILTIVRDRLHPEKPLETLRLTYAGREIHINQSTTVGDCKLPDGSTVHIDQSFLFLRGKKPIIYLLSPQTIEASVKLSLVPQWSLSVIYPVVPIKASSAHSKEEIVWRVRAHPNGELTELTTGLDVAYLFWEALTKPPGPDSPPASPRIGATQDAVTEVFVPNDPVLNDDNAVLISIEKITPYLDAALKALGLHTEARTSFITYWLPSILNHTNIAFRFIPQEAYEKAAPLDISPKPDIITRIFMIFQGVDESDLGCWSAARSKASEDVSFWVDTVGVDVGRTLDSQLFRVIEWGGMELVKPSVKPCE